MRPDMFWMHVSVLSVLVLCLNADGPESECTPEIKVQRNTIYRAILGDELRINCTFSLCEEKTPKVTWYKYDGDYIQINDNKQSGIETALKQLNQSDWIFYLVFKNLLRNDSSDFLCEVGVQRSHIIKVYVNDSDKFWKNSTQSQDPEPTEWLYVYSAAGITSLVAMVIMISLVAMRGCKGKSKTEEQSESQHMMAPTAQQSLPQPRAEGGPSIPPCRRSTQRKPQPRQSWDQERAERGRGRSAVKEGPEEVDRSIVYAALNHPPPSGGRAQPRKPAEIPSEYAAIRVA